MPREWLEDFEQWAHLRHHQAPAAQAAASTSAAETAAAVTIRTSIPGGPVSQLSDFLHAAAAKVEHFDDEALAKLDAVQGNPATAEAFDIIHALSGYDPGPVFRALLTAMKALVPVPAAEAAPEPSFTPAGPQVAGQA